MSQVIRHRAQVLLLSHMATAVRRMTDATHLWLSSHFSERMVFCAIILLLAVLLQDHLQHLELEQHPAGPGRVAVVVFADRFLM